MKKRSHDPEQVALDMLASDLMDQTQRYLECGRKFENLPLDQLKDKWVMAFKAWRKTGNSKEMDDAYAELRLRNTELPVERVPDEIAAMQGEIREAGPDDPGVWAAVERFFEQFKRPRN